MRYSSSTYSFNELSKLKHLQTHVEVESDPADVRGALADGVDARVGGGRGGGGRLGQVRAVLTRRGAATQRD